MLTDAQVSALPSGLYALLVQSRKKKDCDCAERLGINPETGKCRSPSGRPTHFDEAGVCRYPNGLEVPSYAKYCQSCGCYFDRDEQAIVSQHGPLTIEALLAALADATLRAEQAAARLAALDGDRPRPIVAYQATPGSTITRCEFTDLTEYADWLIEQNEQGEVDQ